MAFNIGPRREPKEEEIYHVPGFVNRVNGYLDGSPAHLVEVEPGIEYPEDYVPVQTVQVVEDAPEEIIEERPGPKVRDNGLGIMVVDYPETEPTVIDIQDESDSIPEFESERNLYKTPVSYRKLTASGLGKIVKAAKNTSSVVADKYYSANVVMANAVGNIHSAGEKLASAEHKTARKRVAVAALGGLAVAAVAYAAYRGINLSGSSHSHEAVQAAVPVKTPNHVTDALQTHQSSTSAALSPSIHSVSKTAHAKTAVDATSKSFTIESGHGFTQELSESFSTKANPMSPARSYHLFTALRQHFGDHGILKHGKGLVDSTYTQNGEEYISKPGRGQWASGVAKFAHEWLKTHKS